MKKKEMKKKEYYINKYNSKGITLMTLVITIIILLILAGVVISFTIGKNGIITKAEEAKKIQKIAEIKEQMGLEILTARFRSIRKK